MSLSIATHLQVGAGSLPARATTGPRRVSGTPAPWHRAPGVGDLIALPILRTLDGDPIDLLEIADDRPTVLLVLRGGACSTSAAMLRVFAGARSAIEAAGGSVVAVLAEPPSPTRAGKGTVTLAVDDHHSFARSLDLVVDTAGDDRRGDAGSLVPAAYVLAACGRVTSAHVGADAIRQASPVVAVAAVSRLAAEAPAAPRAVRELWL